MLSNAWWRSRHKTGEQKRSKLDFKISSMYRIMPITVLFKVGIDYQDLIIGDKNLYSKLFTYLLLEGK